MKLKFNESSIAKVETETREKLQKLFKEPALLSQVADVMIKDIQFQARRGRNPITGGNFIPLSKEWIKRRGDLAKTNRTADAYKQSRSNITFTGQLLDSLSKRLTRTGIAIVFAGIHKRYVRSISNLKRSKKELKTPPQLTNDQLAQYVGEIRPFFYIRETLLPQLKSVVIRYIRRRL
jgi:hypothetical protein